MNDEMNAVCANCRWCKLGTHRTARGEEVFCECFYNPPVVVNDRRCYSALPEVNPHDFCHLFTAKP